MKKTIIFVSRTCFCLIALFEGCAAGAQGFVDLNFESADTTGFSPGAQNVPIGAALPGWSGYLGNSSVTTVIYDTVSLGLAAISLHDSLSPLPPLDGRYSVLLQPSNGGPATSAAIAQDGTIPMTSRSMTFDILPGSGFSVTFEGVAIPLMVVGNSPGITVMGGDVSSLAGQTGQLLFQGGGELDDIQFSPLEIPEPNTFGLIAAGLTSALALASARRRRGSQPG